MIRNKLYGVALFIAAQKTVLYHTSTVNCPGAIKEKKQAAGAQFDMNANIDTSDISDKSTSKTGMIAGVSVAAAVVVIAIVVLAIFLYKKKHIHISDEDIETLDDNTKSVSNSNPIYDNNAKDDPFQEDFE